MPVLKDPKREKFAQLCARGLAATDAYVRVGFKRNTGNAASFRKRPDISKRIQELQLEMQQCNEEELHTYIQESGLNQTYLIRQLLETALLAKEGAKYDIASRIFKDIGAELFAMFTEKKHVTVEQQNNGPSTNTATINIAGLNKALENLAAPSSRLPQIDGVVDFSEFSEPGMVIIDSKHD